ncbi:wax ester/triacylglycerol synthase family O-acyltransferase [Halieaceae bacterium IMCC14734]|uniref:diacylglycerol O-acyltransferase n=1 Tax=Candidatus Litorirhabdus singularis TaxID=2518993 RepID=A0ABT3TGU9_9GAMM|nr:wax ester/triacylglycerol synthase family O-acyltransferase [Candidatus Litorirhabdus singularis]MCX2981532.1 wax ester/triacylglycerol synthase family O-acyltransferase [Candidatus Litorirhabdus singularis]
MKQLGVLDSAFINLEQSNTPQHVGGLGIYDPSSAPDGFVRFKQVIANFEQRLQRMPLFRTRLVEVPGGIDRPYWVKDANFDVEFHLRHIALPEPGDWRQLCIQVARLHARPLDMSRPLWEAYIIEGLDNMSNLPADSFAVYTKMHHSLVDGAGGASFMAALHDLTANPDEQPAAEEPLLVDRQPSNAELLGKASINRVKNSVKLARSSVSFASELGKYALQVARKEVSVPDIQSPKTRFNNPVGPHRVFDAVDFPLADFKKIKDHAGVKLNDVALCIVGGAMQSYLSSKNETPELPLAASLPVNMRTRRGATDDNNQVGAIFASLHSNITDPLERLKAIHHSTIEAKEYGETSPLVDALKIAGIFSPAVSKAAASIWSERQLSRHVPLNTSTVITNVPGPNFDLYCAGARMVQYHGMGVLTPGVGLFHTVFSQGERVNMSVLGNRDIMPDPAFYIDCLRNAYAELLQQVERSEEKPPAAKKKVAKAPSKAPAKKASVKKTAAKKVTVKKAPTKNTLAKKPAVKKAAAKKPPAKRKASSVKPAAQKAAPKKAAASARPKAKRKIGAVAPKLR